MRLREFFIYSFFIAIVFVFFSCSSIPVQDSGQDMPDEVAPTEDGTKEVDAPIQIEEFPSLDNRLVLTFGGDIMAHVENFGMTDYNMIYADIEEIIQNDDFTFANLETPVHDGRPYESYPTFNVQPEYAQAAIDAGFEVFSLANNHTNDQGYEGMEKTLGFFQSKEAEGVFAAGIKPAGYQGLTYQVIEKGDWKILFVAVTEILNRFNDYQKIDYVAPSASRRKTLFKELAQLRQENPCDIFVLSLHTCEDEYVHEITQVRRDFYRTLLDSGVDFVWANHPHLAKEWEVFTDKLKSLGGRLAKTAKKKYAANAVFAETDSQGRILLSQNLREHADLGHDVIVIGNINRAEIWNPERWDKFNEEYSDDELAAALEEIDI